MKTYNEEHKFAAHYWDTPDRSCHCLVLSFVLSSVPFVNISYPQIRTAIPTY